MTPLESELAEPLEPESKLVFIHFSAIINTLCIKKCLVKQLAGLAGLDASELVGEGVSLGRGNARPLVLEGVATGLSSGSFLGSAGWQGLGSAGTEASGIEGPESEASRTEGPEGEA